MENQSKQLKLNFLEGLRGLAALYVVIHHARWFLWEGYSEGFLKHSEQYSFFSKLLVYFLSMFIYGHEMVLFFFLLSGFVIHLRYARNLNKGIYKFDFWPYFKRRFRRIYPPFVFAIVFTFLLDSLGKSLGFEIYNGPKPFGIIEDDFSLTTLLGNLLFLMNTYVNSWGSDFALWSLKFEWWFYMFYPLFFLLIKRNNGLAFLSIAALFLASLFPQHWPIKLLQEVFAYMLVWWFGVILADIYTGRINLKFYYLIPMVIFIPIAIVIKAKFGIADIYSNLIWGIGWMGVLSFFFYLNEVSKYIRPIEKLQSLGSYSYTLYIIHSPILVFMSGYLVRTNNKLPSNLIYIAIGTVISMVIAWLLHFVIERPFIGKPKKKQKMLTKHVCILTHAHLCRNPRVVKEANLLSALGHKVTVITCLFEKNLVTEDISILAPQVTVSYYLDLSANDTIAKIEKLIRKFAVLIKKYVNLSMPYALGYGYKKLFNAALKANADLYICHQELPTIVGTELIKQNKKVAFDIEDWYAEDLPTATRKGRPIDLLKKAEKIALQRGAFCVTTSHAMAKQLAKTYGTKIPEVIYNTFEKVQGLAPTSQSKPSLVWFSQTIGPGRGLETLAAALQKVKFPLQLHLRGVISKDYKAWLSDALEHTAHEIHFHSLTSPLELPKKLNQNDIGLALELNQPLSRDLTITNKIIQYMQSGLAVIASNTQGQQELAQLANSAIRIFQQDDHEQLALQISELTSDKKQLAEAKNQALQFFNEKICWEIVQEKYKTILTKTLSF